MTYNIAKEQIAHNNGFINWEQLAAKYSSPTFYDANMLCNYLIEAVILYELYATEKIKYLDQKVKNLQSCK